MADRRKLDDAARLHRQVYKVKEDGTAMSVNFIVTPKDEGLLSTRQDSLVDAKRAYDEHKAAGLQTVGTWSFLVGDIELDAIDDADQPDMPEGHASVDFTGLSTRGQRERAGKQIKSAASQTYKP